MKLRNIFTALAAVLALTFVGCQEEERILEEVQVSKSMVALPIEGGSAEITVTAADTWEIVDIPEWLTVAPAAGAAGQTTVTFSAEAASSNNEVMLHLNCGEVSQVINVIQMAEKVDAPLTDCATVLAENNVGKVYKCKGTITDLTNYDKYGCFYINDGTATVYVYGSMNPGQFKPEVGDIITFEGPWTSYGNFDDVTILTLEKSLIKLEKVIPADALPKDGGVLTVVLTVKGEGLKIEIPEADQAWLTAGEPEAVGTSTFVELTAAANEKGARSTTVTFKTVSDGIDYVAMANVDQLGAIAEVSVADFLAAPEGTALYKLTGKVANLKPGDYGNFDLVDASGSVYVYGLTATPVAKNDKSFPTLGIKEGDIVTLIGTRASYNGTPQVGGPAYYVSHEGHTESTVANFLAQSTGDAWYRLTGTITNLKTGNFGNFDLVDETGSVYVYGLTVAPVAKNDQSFPTLGLKEGDVVTLIGKRADYKGTAQVGGPAYYISHQPASGDDQVKVGPFTSNITWTANKDNKSYDDGAATVNGTALDKVLKFGTSSVIGTATVVVPAGTKKIGLWGVAWKDKKGTLVASVAGQQIYSLDFASNDGATNNAPYTITVADSDYYEFDLASILGSALPVDTEVTLSTVEGATRVIVWGLNAYAE